jgi:PAS domain S-box-containing protein
VTSPTTDRARLSPDGSRVLALAPGLSIAAALAIIDIWAQPSTAVIGMVVVAPLLTVLFGTPRDIALVGVLAVALVLASAIWHDNSGAVVYVYRTCVVVAVSVLAFLVARNRARVHRDRERFSLLASIAEIADGTRTLEDTVQRLNDLVVPLVADVCIVDAVSQGELTRLAVRSSDTTAAEVHAGLAARPPSTADDPADPEQARLVARVDDALLQRMATGPDDLAVLRALCASSFVVVPLRARGRRIGSLTLVVTARSGRRYREEDLEFAKVVAGRAALALDNAGLFSELETIEAQLTAALSTLAEAVTVQHAEGALMYANDAAARMLGYESPRELLATPVHELVEKFDTSNEDGSPLRIADLPGRRVLAGLEAKPLVTHTVNRETGEEGWRLTKASGVYDRDGKVKLVVNVIEDITEVKRAETTQRMLARAGELLSSSLD